MNTDRWLRRIEVHRIRAIAAPPRPGNAPLRPGLGTPANAPTRGLQMRLLGAPVNHALRVIAAARGIESACASVSALPEPPR